MRDEEVEFIMVDLFCGLGGTTEGFSDVPGWKIIAAINHDPVAIQSHWSNHPEVKHFEEDVRTLDLVNLAEYVRQMRIKYPNAKLVLWASLECTNFSKAKGGRAREADSRTLAYSLIRHYDSVNKNYEDNTIGYIQALDPDFVMIENVVEFRQWGPLDEKGKPISKLYGQDWVKWCSDIDQLGYYNDWTMLNAADFGERTSRNRLFGSFAKHGLPIMWPQPTHAKNPAKKGLPPGLKPWEPCRPCLNLENKGKSFFIDIKPMKLKNAIKYISCTKKRNKPRVLVIHAQKNRSMILGTLPHMFIRHEDVPVMDKMLLAFAQQMNVDVQELHYYRLDQKSDKTAGRVLSGLIKHVAGSNEREFIIKYMGNNADTGINSGKSTKEPLPTVTCRNMFYLTQPEFIVASNGGSSKGKSRSSAEPAQTITTADNKALVMLMSYYSNSKSCQSVDVPCGTITVKDRQALLEAQWLDKQYTGPANHGSLEQPAGTITGNPKFALVSTEWIDRQFTQGGRNSSVHAPAGSILSVPKMGLVSVAPFILNPGHGGNNSSTADPAPTVVARQDKAPLSVVVPEPFVMSTIFNNGTHGVDEPLRTITADRHWDYIVEVMPGMYGIEIYVTDSEAVRNIKQFMAMYGIGDITMRMLEVIELKRIQGFKDSYVIKGNQAQQKKGIGNSVNPKTAKMIGLTMKAALHQLKAMAA